MKGARPGSSRAVRRRAMDDDEGRVVDGSAVAATGCGHRVPSGVEEPTKPFVVLLALVTRCKLLRQIPRSSRPLDDPNMPPSPARVDEANCGFSARRKIKYLFGRLFFRRREPRRAGLVWASATGTQAQRSDFGNPWKRNDFPLCDLERRPTRRGAPPPRVDASVPAIDTNRAWRVAMTTLLLPGLHGSGPDHWQRRWLEEVDDMILVEQDDWDRPDLASWLARAEAAVEANPGAFVAAHSLGAVLAVHLASRRPDLPIAGLLLVAPADVDRHARKGPHVAAFAPLPTGPLGCPAIVVASRDDPWMSFSRAGVLADMWEAGLVDAGHAGHVNADSGLGRWEAGLDLIDRLRRMGGGRIRRTAVPLRA
jgi:predicted alpha/beta hydrolase family esterase